MIKENTKVAEVSDQEVEALLGIGTGAASIMVPDEKENTSFFRSEDDKAFIERVLNPKEEEKPADTAIVVPPVDPLKPKATDTSVLEVAANLEEEEEEEDEITPGKTSAIAQVTNNFIKKGILVPFAGEEDLSKYKIKDYEELIEMNLKKIQDDALATTQEAFYNSLPEEMKRAYQYIYNGGTDLKPLFRDLAAVEEIKTLDIASEQGQEQTVRAYLQATKYGTPEEIQDEINSLKDRGDIEKKAKMFQPKLKAMSDTVVQQRVQYQENLRIQRQEQSKAYEASVYDLIAKGDLNGIPLDPNTQNLLFTGLTQANYQSAQGGNTNLLGHLLEKYQWGEHADHSRISEALWLLADRDSYHEQIKKGVKKETDGKVLRILKDAANDKVASSSTPEEVPVSTKRTIKRELPKKGFFSR